jgi:preprotein translocase subunit YajC
VSAGSSPDTGKSGIKGFVISISEPQVVEIDTGATAAYIRLRASAVARTEPFGSEKGFVVLDFDAQENVVAY